MDGLRGRHGARTLGVARAFLVVSAVLLVLGFPLLDLNPLGTRGPDLSGSVPQISAVELAPPTSDLAGPAMSRDATCPSAAEVTACESMSMATALPPNTSAPSPRCCASIAFDPSDNSTFLFGGEGAGPYFNDTWRFHGDHWSQVVNASGPSSRGEAMMTYDPTTGLILLYGGVAPNYTTLGDLWTFNGSSWRLNTPQATPGGRAGGIFVYDPPLGGVILYGGTRNDAATGFSTKALNDTWLLRAGTWTNMTAAVGPAPPAAAGMASTFDPVASGILLFGGGTAGGYLNETWLLGNQTWKRVPTNSSPAPRWFASLGFDTADNESVLFGGEGGGGGSAVFLDTWVFHNGSWAVWNGSGRPTPLGGVQASMSTAPGTGGALLFGGSTGTYLVNATWIFAAGRWTEVPMVPVKMPGGVSAIASDPVSNLTLLVGPGYASQAAQTWMLINRSWMPLNLMINPPSVWYPALVYDPDIGCFVLFGGDMAPDSAATTNESWVFCSGTWMNATSRMNNAPSPRWGAQVAYDAAEGAVVLFGGSNGIYNFTDTWELQGWNWSELTLSVHPGEGGFAQAMSMAYDAGTDTLVWLGLSGWNIYRSEMWTFANGTWTNSTSLLPAELTDVWGVALEYDYRDGYLLGFGGACTQECDATSAVYRGNETWAYHAGVWKVISAQVCPPPRAEGRMAFDPAYGAVILFGGVGSTGLDDTWAFSGGNWTEFSPALSVVPGAVDIGRNVSITIHPVDFSPIQLTMEGGLLAESCSQTAEFSFTCNFASPGRYPLKFSMLGADGLVATATGEAVANPLPIVQSVAAVPSNPSVGKPFNLSVTLSGGTSPFDFSYTGLPPGCLAANHSQFQCVPETDGNYSINVSVEDSSLIIANASLRLFVNPAPNLPSTKTSATGSLGGWLVFAVLAVTVAVVVSTFTVRRALLKRDAARLVKEMREYSHRNGK